jgi:hypothetical protein
MAQVIPDTEDPRIAAIAAALVLAPARGVNLEDDLRAFLTACKATMAVVREGPDLDVEAVLASLK